MRRLTRWLCVLLGVITALLTVTVPPTITQAVSVTPEYVADEVLVKLRSNVSLVSVALASGLDPHPIDQLGTSLIYRMRIVDNTAPSVKAAALNATQLVEYAEPNYIGDAPEAGQQSAWVKADNIGNYSNQWAADQLGLSKAHLVSKGANVTVAVLDTGADLLHPALVDRLVPGFDFVDGDADPSEEGVYGHDIAYGHGTHVAGLIAMVAPEAKIMPLRMLKPDGTGNSWLLAQAVRYASSHQVDVLNLSYSVKRRSLIVEEAVGDAIAMAPGAVVVAAAGNSASATPEYPAAEEVPGLLAVAASTRADKLASFSTYGSWVELAAPGERIVSSVPLASGGAYASWSGTSMATPLVAGTVALVRAVDPMLKPVDVAERVIAAAASMKGPVPRRLDSASSLGL